MKTFMLRLKQTNNLVKVLVEEVLLFSHWITSEQNDTPQIVEPDEADIVHLAPSNQFAFFGIDGLEEAIETLHPTLSHKTRIQLKDLSLKEFAVDFGIQVGFFSHQLGKPFETSLAIGNEDGSFDQTVPDLSSLGSTKPQLSVFQKKPQKT